MFETEPGLKPLPTYEHNGITRMRYAQLGYVALNVTSLERSRSFYESMVGLQYSGGGAGHVFFRHSDDHHNFVLHQAAEPGLRHIGWELEDEETVSDSFALLQHRRHDVRWLAPAECDFLHLDRGFVLTDPSGVKHAYYSGLSKFALEPFQPTVANILRLGHVVLKTDVYERALDFAFNEQNFRASDSVRGKIMFMRGFPSPFHHGLGIANSTKRGLHHVNFMVDSIDDVGRALSRFQANGVPIVYGPGRHPTSDSVFLYFLDPDGLTLEYSFGMERFDEHRPRKARVFESVSKLDTWNSRQDPAFAAVGSIATEGVLSNAHS
jgi:2,3-dihydroxy-p-cumate/2,3-dihydroxybenzoate 3,4-dioxygenase